MKVTDVEIVRLAARLPPELQRTRQRSVRMQDLYEPADDPDESHGDVVHHYLTIRTDEDAAGVYGPVSAAALPAIRQGLAAIVIGADPLRHNLLWERMLRSERHLRTGHGMMAVSALDNALWDLRGRFYDQPVFELLGGATRDTVPTYASTLGYHHGSADVIRRSAELAAEYPAQKWFMAHGPSNRQRALEAAVELAEVLRQTVGPDYPLMFDAVMGWDFALAETWCRRVTPLEPTWLEEPFPAYDLRSYERLANRTTVPLAAGEHIYGRWEASNWLESGAVRYLQCDPEWCGGVSELVRIGALCSANATALVPHGANIHAALHVAATLPPWLTPWVEWLIDLTTERAIFEAQPVEPIGGTFPLPTRPGFGIELHLDRADHVSTWSAADG